MTADIDAIASAVLYEGYLLWPYRRSATKNRQRWTFGGCYPRRFSETAGTNDPWWRQTECLIAGAAPRTGITIRFLHVVHRQVFRNIGKVLEPVDMLKVGPERYATWEEATERSVGIPDLELPSCPWSGEVPFCIPAGSQEDSVIDSTGVEAGRLVRRWRRLTGTVNIESMPVSDGLFKLRIRVGNTTEWTGEDRAATLALTLVSTHLVLRAKNGRFVSLLEPEKEWQPLAEQCENVGMWPVLVGSVGAHDTMLASPIILYDYPKVAPESPGDLYDATEIDQLLTLNILALTDEEKAEVQASDARGTAILARTEALRPDDFIRLHGRMEAAAAWRELDRPGPQTVLSRGMAITKGSVVRLRPRPSRDLWDAVLAGQIAHVEAIEQDLDDQVQLAVSIDADPGRDLAALSPGHRFFFSPDEVEVLTDELPL